MGVAVSSWPLARAVALRGQIGVVSGTALDLVLARRLQLGDIGGHIAEALAHFPIKDMAERVWERYFVPGGKAEESAFKSKPLPAVEPGKAAVELNVVASFVEVFLAKHGHDGAIGINLLEKIQLPTVPAIFGAMLAGVDYVLMGAGIPRAIPGVLDQLAIGQVTELRVDVVGPDGDTHAITTFDPSTILGTDPINLKRPKFLAIVTSHTLAQMLAKKITPPADGFVIEHNTAGGHNAPPRGTMQLTDDGQPIYGERDIPDLAKFRELGLPFWLAGSEGTHAKLKEALENGAQGVQIGTAFAFCNESGILPHYKADIIQKSLRGKVNVYTDAKASPTGFPFKVVQLDGTMSVSSVYENRKRICDLGYLRTTYLKEDGSFGYRCASEPVEDFVAKGGDIAETVGRKCVCNGLMVTVGLGQWRKDGGAEIPLVTAGDAVAELARYVKPGETGYSSDDVIDIVLGLAPDNTEANRVYLEGLLESAKA